MKLFRATIKPLTAFATPLFGDTLFGQCCWAVRHAFSEQRVKQLLEGYTTGQPFMVVSSAFVAGHIKRPAMPLPMLGFTEGVDRKAAKSRHHIPLTALGNPLREWATQALDDADLKRALQLDKQHAVVIQGARTHNSINRQTGTTGRDGGFAPYDRQLEWYHPQLLLDFYLVIDESRFLPEEARQVLINVGLQGFGKEASSGLGKFSLNNLAEWQPSRPDNANAWYTLAPCVPQGLPWHENNCYYQPFVRFGRHGDVGVHSGNPFKNPVLMAQAGAILSPSDGPGDALFTGQGLGGVSKTMASAVHQGYAPVLPVVLA